MANRITADNRCIGPNRSPSFYKCSPEFLLPRYKTPGVKDIRKDHGGATEYIIFQNHAIIKGDIVLNLDVISQNGAGRNKYILPDDAILPDLRPGHDMREMPDLGLVTNFDRFIYHSRRMHKIPFFHLLHLTPTLSPRIAPGAAGTLPRQGGGDRL